MVPGFTAGVVLDSGARIGEVYGDELMAEKLGGLAYFDSELAVLPVSQWSRASQ